MKRAFDMLGMGQNATDTVIIVPRYPAYNSKSLFAEERVEAGGQVATAVIACRTLGKRCKYIGTVGDDERGHFQLRSLQTSGVDITDVHTVPGCPNQTAYIIIDRRTGERTILWHRDPRLELKPEMLSREIICSAHLLHLDAGDLAAAATAACWARGAGIPVTCDIDTLYDDTDRLLRHLDYFIASANVPEAYTGQSDPFKALEAVRQEFGMRVAAMTLGADGVIALAETGFLYSPAYEVDAIDTTGAGDVFRGAFCYALLEDMPLDRALDFSCAAAALNCTKVGARGGVPSLPEVLGLMERAGRRVNREYLVR
jgi:sulfofructose kinase